MTELTRRQSNQSKKADIVECYYQWQILTRNSKRKAKRSFTQEKTNLKGITGMARFRSSDRDQNEPSCLRVNKPYESGPHLS
jgi:ribosomal protein L4